MKHFKINVGRKKLTSEYIQSKQDFDMVLKRLQTTSASPWNFIWPYGIGTIASVILIVGIYWFYFSEDKTAQKHGLPLTECLLSDHTQEIFEETDARFYIQTLSQTEQIQTYAFEKSQQIDVSTKSKKKVITAIKQEQQPNQPVVIELEDKTEIQPVLMDTTKLSEVIDADQQSVSFPTISGIHSGNIQWEEFEEGSIEVNEDLTICAFSIQYTSRRGDKTVSVTGHQIPSDVIFDLRNIGLDQKVFITNVIANNSKGERSRLVSMELNLKFSN